MYVPSVSGGFFERLSCDGNGVPFAWPFVCMRSMPCCWVSTVNLAVIVCTRSAEVSV